MNKEDWLGLLLDAILHLEKKIQRSPEPPVLMILERYRIVLERIRRIQAPVGEDFREIVNLARGYLETSPDYSQEFLEAIYRVELEVRKQFPPEKDK